MFTSLRMRHSHRRVDLVRENEIFFQRPFFTRYYYFIVVIVLVRVPFIEWKIVQPPPPWVISDTERAVRSAAIRAHRRRVTCSTYAPTHIIRVYVYIYYIYTRMYIRRLIRLCVHNAVPKLPYSNGRRSRGQRVWELKARHAHRTAAAAIIPRYRYIKYYNII